MKSLWKKIGWLRLALIVALLFILGVGAFMSVDHIARTDPQFCASCHNMESHVESYLEETTHLAHAHAEAGVGCKECHSDYTVADEVGSLVNFVVGNYTSEPVRRRVEDDMCLDCHISMEHQAERTDFLPRNPHRSHFELACQDCHMGHDDQINYCRTCHENGGQRMLGDEAEPRGRISGILGDGEAPDFSEAPSS